MKFAAHTNENAGRTVQKLPGETGNSGGASKAGANNVSKDGAQSSSKDAADSGSKDAGSMRQTVPLLMPRMASLKASPA